MLGWGGCCSLEACCSNHGDLEEHVGVGGLQLQMAASLAKAGSAPEAGCCSHMANAYGQNKEHVEEHPLDHDYPTQNQESPACTCQWDVAWLLSWTGNHLADAEVSDKGSL